MASSQSATPGNFPGKGDQSAPGAQSQDAPSRPASMGSVSMFEGANRFTMSGMTISHVGGNAYSTTNNNNSRIQDSHNTYNTTNTGSQNQSHVYSDSSADNRRIQSHMWSQSVNQSREESFRPSYPPGQANYPPQAYYDPGRPGAYEDRPQYRPSIPHAPYSDPYAQYGYLPPNQPPMLPYAPHPIPQPRADTRQYAPYPGNPYNGYSPREEYHHHPYPAQSPPPSGYYYPSPSPPPRPTEFSVNPNMAPNHKRYNPFVQPPQSQAQVEMDRFSRSAPPPGNGFGEPIQRGDVEMN
ncbi:hypothetical protein D9758_011016 [Tetrapyrgos nigripes]|uniref:Uncharacterized protein n=1 Tax=Tetrapyrgos nigripes TaxID=182062 RepID=A0A8H5GHU4_9AGAR|nr:hypothetical protein D9758_011016 [Tetrapyrgos nigripes]